MAWRIEQDNGILLPDLGWRLDARAPTNRSFVSHAHFDHMGDHGTILCSPSTRALIEERLPGERLWRTYDFHEPFELEPGVSGCLLPAGHIIGSTMLRLEKDGESLLYTGDFKLTPGTSAERCEPTPADTLIVETTFGLPRYAFPPPATVVGDIVRFCRETIENGETPVLFGYSLGKSQEILKGLSDSGLPAMLHPQSLKMTDRCAALGWSFPPYAPFDPEDHQGRVVISPPLPRNSTWLKNIKRRRCAIISGWAIEPSAIYRYQCDRAFPLSDHADYLDLQAFVNQVNPRVVYTVHGFAQEFALTLREQGYQAWALGRQNQLDLGLELESPVAAPPPATAPTEPAADLPATSFARLATIAAAIADTDSKKRKVELLAGFLEDCEADEASIAAVFLTGRPFPQSSDKKLNLGAALVRQATTRAAGSDEAAFKRLHRQLRDSVETAVQMLAPSAPPPSRTLGSILSLFDSLAAAPSPSFRLSLLSEQLRRLSPEEVRLLLKIISGDLRIGLKEGLVEEAIAQRFKVPKESVRKAHLRSGDIAAVTRAAAADDLASIRLAVFHPLQFMLASPEPDGEAVVKRLGERVWAEDKYDGIRCQIHKRGEHVELYSRDLNRITHQFPEIVEAVREIPQDFVGDGEVVAWGQERPLPFSELQKRLGRKAEDLFLGEEVPVILFLYDLLWSEGRELLDAPLEERRARLDAFTVSATARIAPVSILEGAKAIETAFLAARARGNEGLVLKDPRSAYQPGRRGLAWLKLKKAFATIDAVVVAVEYGHGKRKDSLSDYTFAVRDEESGRLLPIGKAFTGLTDGEIEALTQRFLDNALDTRGRLIEVKPEVVLEIAFDSIRPSGRHASGLALRFPRIKRIRNDKSPESIDTLQHCRRLAQLDPAAT